VETADILACSRSSLPCNVPVLDRRMVAAAEDYCRAADCRFMDLTIVNLRTELPAFYHRLGYTESGTLPFPRDQHTNEPLSGKNVEGSPLARVERTLLSACLQQQ